MNIMWEVEGFFNVSDELMELEDNFTLQSTNLNLEGGVRGIPPMDRGL